MKNTAKANLTKLVEKFEQELVTRPLLIMIKQEQQYPEAIFYPKLRITPPLDSLSALPRILRLI